MTSSSNEARLVMGMWRDSIARRPGQQTVGLPRRRCAAAAADGRMSLTMIRSLDSRIESTPGVLSGKPRIAGRRIAVSMVAEWHLQQGESVESICQQYDLSPAEVHAALAYYFDHRQEIDKRTAQDRAYVEEMRKQHPPSDLRERLKAAGREEDVRFLDE